MERVTAHYHELALKGGNRPRFERTLVRNLARTLSDLPGTKVRPLHGRVLIETEADLEVVLTRARAVCGPRAFRIPNSASGRALARMGDR